MIELAVSEIDEVSGGRCITCNRSPIDEPKKLFEKEPKANDANGRQNQTAGLYDFIQDWFDETGVWLMPAEARRISGL
ncbi:MAG: hypothetical protein AAF553_10000 [Pseudomonadota bacterium]